MNRYIDKTPKSKKLFDRAKRVLPSGVSYGIRAIEPYPFYVERANGAKIVDVDGNLYTDYWLGHGALILGHSPEPVITAVGEQLEKGTHYGLTHEYEVELAERIISLIPSADKVRFTNSGTEANMYAIRLARSYSNETKILKVEGGWHGGYDALHKGVHPPFDTPDSAGLDANALKNTLVVPFNNLNATREAVKNNDLACIIVEPVMGAAGFILPEEGYLSGLREICDETGSLLIFDEVITGFRLAPGGAQEYYGVFPDITILGKVLGGGFPIGAFSGRDEILELIDHKKYPKKDERSAHGGTFTANPISTIAGIATIDYLVKNNVYHHIDKLGKNIRDGLKDICKTYPLEASITGVGSTFAIHFQKHPPRNGQDIAMNDTELTSLFYKNMLGNGIVYMSSKIAHCWLSETHTEEDIEKYLQFTESFFRNYS